jgi:hypothetical protein
MQQELRHRRKAVETAAEELRHMARRTPMWTVQHTSQGLKLVESATGALLAELRGPWAVDLARTFGAIQQYSLGALAELLWRIGGHGGGTDVLRNAEQLIAMLGLTDPASHGIAEPQADTQSS